MNPASVPDPDAPSEEGSFQHAALWKRAVIVAAGPITNLVIAIAIFAAFFAIIGKPVIVGGQDSRTIGAFTDDSAAQAAGLKVGDLVVSIDGRPIRDFTELKAKVALHPGKQMMFMVERAGETIEYSVTTSRIQRTDNFGNVSTEGLIGVAPAGGKYELQKVGVLEAIPLGAKQSWDFMGMMITGIQQIITGERSVDELGGPLKIAKFSGEQMSMGAAAFIHFAALISLNLAFINFLPIPALDGGHLMFYAAEAIRKKPVGPQVTEWAYRTGIALVLMLMVVVTVNDIFSLPIFGS